MLFYKPDQSVPILTGFDAILEKRAVAPMQRADYKKWFRVFLDLCTKYPVPKARPDQVRLSIDKLGEKRQTPLQQNQAAHAVSLYFENITQTRNLGCGFYFVRPNSHLMFLAVDTFCYERVCPS